MYIKSENSIACSMFRVNDGRMCRWNLIRGIQRERLVDEKRRTIIGSNQGSKWAATHRYSVPAQYCCFSHVSGLVLRGIGTQRARALRHLPQVLMNHISIHFIL